MNVFALAEEKNKRARKLVESVVQTIPRWHFPMLNDDERNEAFKRSIQKLDLAEKNVLDIGTGTGLLSMIAAKSGAKHVYSVEGNPHIARKAREIISHNKLSHKITVINAMSYDLIPGVDLPENIDVLISETIDCGFVGEHFLASLKHAKDNLLSKDAILLPRSCRLVGCLLSSDKIRKLNQVNYASDFDVSHFNDFSTMGYFPVRLNTWQHEIVSQQVHFYHKQFDATDEYTDSGSIDFVVTKDCVVDGVVFWFECELVQGETPLVNSPGNGNSHWMQAVHIFDKPKRFSSRETCQLDYIVSESTVDFSEPN